MTTHYKTKTKLGVSYTSPIPILYISTYLLTSSYLSPAMRSLVKRKAEEKSETRSRGLSIVSATSIHFQFKRRWEESSSLKPNLPGLIQFPNAYQLLIPPIVSS